MTKPILSIYKTPTVILNSETTNQYNGNYVVDNTNGIIPVLVNNTNYKFYYYPGTIGAEFETTSKLDFNASPYLLIINSLILDAEIY